MDKFQTINDLSTTGILAVMQSIALAAPGLISVVVFFLWFAGAGASYFSILKTSGRKVFFQTTLAVSFVIMLVALFFASMNTAEVTILSGYWVGFYILTTLMSWYGLSQQ